MHGVAVKEFVHALTLELAKVILLDGINEKGH
jgi:hypothetical protein